MSEQPAINPDEKAKVRVMLMTVQDRIQSYKKPVEKLSNLGQKLTALLHEDGPKNPWQDTMTRDEVEKHLARCQQEFEAIFKDLKI